MKIVSKLNSSARKHRRTIAASLAFIGVTVGVFFAGAWAGSSGALKLGPATSAVSTATNASSHNGSDKHGGCPHMAKMMGDMSKDKMPSGMPMDKMPQDTSHGN